MEMVGAILAAALFVAAPIGAYLGGGAFYRAVQAKNGSVLIWLGGLTLGCVVISAVGFGLALEAMTGRLQ
jgi:hypothetical protein